MYFSSSHFTKIHFQRGAYDAPPDPLVGWGVVSLSLPLDAFSASHLIACGASLPSGARALWSVYGPPRVNMAPILHSNAFELQMVKPLKKINTVKLQICTDRSWGLLSVQIALTPGWTRLPSKHVKVVHFCR